MLDLPVEINARILFMLGWKGTRLQWGPEERAFPE